MNSINQAKIDYRQADSAKKYRSFGHVFPKHCRFDYTCTTQLLNRLKAERIKAVLAADKGWFIVNAMDGAMTVTVCKPSANSRIEIITAQTGR